MKRINALWIALGAALFAAGLILVKVSGGAAALPYLCIGVGSGLFGHGMGETLSARARRTDPERFRQMDIEKKDERNIVLAARARAKAFDLMTFVFGALLIAFAFMGVATAPLLLLVFAYLFVHGSAIYYRAKLEKEM